MAMNSDALKRRVGSLGAMLGVSQIGPQATCNGLDEREEMLAIFKAEEIRKSVAHSSMHCFGSRQMTLDMEDINNEVEKTSDIPAMTEPSVIVDDTRLGQHNEETTSIECVVRSNLTSSSINAQPSEVSFNEGHTTEDITVASLKSSFPLPLSKIYGKKHRERKVQHQYIGSECLEGDVATRTLQGGSSTCARVESTQVGDIGSNVGIKPYDYSSAKKTLGFEDSLGSQGEKLIQGKQHGKKTSHLRIPDHSSADASFDPLHRVRNDLNAQNLRPGKRRQVFPQSGNRTGIFS